MRPPRLTETLRPGRGGGSPLTPNSAKRIALFGSVVVALFGLLVVRLWFLQVVGARGFEAQAVGNSVRTINIPAPRGEILDRNGVVLAGSRLAWDIVALPQDLVAGNGKDSKITEAGDKTLKKLAKATDEPLVRLRRLMVRGNKKAAYKSVVLKADISDDLRIALAERIRQFPGIRLERSFRRDYRFGSSLSHVLGYVGQIGEDEIDQKRLQGYRNDAIIGKAGLEQRYEEFLRGKDGEQRVEVDVTGQPVGRGTLSIQEARPGKTLQTTIDIKVQQQLEDAIRFQVLLKGEFDAGGGGVVLDVASGEVVAMASFPDLDPRAFSRGRTKEIRAALKPIAQRKPFLNRALLGYPPASTFKPVTAIAALNASFFTPDDFLSSPKTVKLYGTPFNNFRRIELPDMQFRRAIAMSSDTFFYQVGAKIYQQRPGRNLEGENKLRFWSEQLGLGRSTGVDIPGERGGELPDKAWKIRNLATRHPRNWDKWLPGDTINMSIGQGFLSATPLQMARAYASILDEKHRLLTPTVGREIRDPKSDEVLSDLSKGRPQTVLPEFQPRVLETVLGGMYDVTNTSEGTAAPVFSRLGGIVAGKTGTAENGKRDDHSWFVGYAPANVGATPKYVVAVIIENAGLGAEAAAPAACLALAAAVPYEPDRCGRGGRPAQPVGAD
jgi:penicillin-binding protein 2